MIILGPNKPKHGSIASDVLKRREGKGKSIDSLAFDSDSNQEESNKQALELAAYKMIEAIKSNNAKDLQESLKYFILECSKKSE